MLTAIKRYNVDSMGLMTIAGTETFSHDAMGNPTSYALKTLTWSGKQLIRYYYQPGKNQLYNYTYAYDENGLRTQKVLNGVTTSYYYNGSVLMGMVTGSGNTAIHQLFSYDSSGNVVAVDYSSNGGSTFTTYYYLRNAQNDVVKLIDGSGNTVVQYTYDSWGKLLSTTGSLAATLGTNQPFRYRGYVYDTETGWYYLQSRYYDPSIGRFISADVYLSTGQGVVGHNSYAYCGNNPVNKLDPSGMFWVEIGQFLSNAWNSVKTWAKNTFGAGSSTTTTIFESETPILPDPLPITVKIGTQTTQIVTSHGDSSKPISVYANGDLDNYLESSAGVNINIDSFALNLSLGLADTGISFSLANGNTTNSFGLKVNLLEMKIGFENSTAVQWDDIIETTYVNSSISGWAIASLYMATPVGQSMPSHAYASVY